MPVVDLNSLDYERITLRSSDFADGQQNNTALGAGNVGEIATLEVYDDGQASAYEAIQIGQPPANATGDNLGNEVFVDMADGGGTSVDDTVEFAIGARQKGELGGGSDGAITGWITQRGEDSSSAIERTPLSPHLPVVKAGALLNFLVKEEGSGTTVDRSQSVWEIPALGGK